MYCTIADEPPSIAPLSPDALASFQQLRRHALALASVSASFTSEAAAVADAYASALLGGSPESWASFVRAADSLTRHSEGIAAIVHLNPRERAACDFFAQIARENADLLAPELFSAA